MMLEYVKAVLLKVSFGRALFEKELRKGYGWLEGGELRQLRQWCYEEFGAVPARPEPGVRMSPCVKAGVAGM